MKKLLPSLILFSTLTVFTSDNAALKEVQEAILRQQQIAANDAALHKTINLNIDQAPTCVIKSVENFIKNYPWYSICGAIVFTFAAIKAWDYASKSNKNDENPDFIN